MLVFKAIFWYSVIPQKWMWCFKLFYLNSLPLPPPCQHHSTPAVIPLSCPTSNFCPLSEPLPTLSPTSGYSLTYISPASSLLALFSQLIGWLANLWKTKTLKEPLNVCSILSFWSTPCFLSLPPYLCSLSLLSSLFCLHSFFKYLSLSSPESFWLSNIASTLFLCALSDPSHILLISSFYNYFLFSKIMFILENLEVK